MTTSQKTEHVCEMFEQIIDRDMPQCRFYRCDNGGDFVSSKLQEICKRRGTWMIKSRAYSPRSNDSVERLNQTLKKLIEQMIHEKYRELKAKPSFNTLANIVSDSTRKYNLRHHSITRIPHVIFIKQIR